jgi:nucleoside-diphosphate-sugar epimerase
MRVALGKGVRHVVVCSSTAVFGRPSALPLTPDSESRPSTFHEETMLRREELVQNLARKGRISATVARTNLVIGPNARHIADFFRRIIAGRYRVFGSEDVYYQVVDVDDVVQGLRLCGDQQSSPGESYILAGKDALRLTDFVKLVAKEGGTDFQPRYYPLAPFELVGAALKVLYAPFGREHPMTLKIESFKRHRLHDISKAERDLGYSPNFTQRESIQRTLEWMRESGRL